MFCVLQGGEKVKIKGSSSSRPASAVRQVGMALPRLKIILIAKLLPWLEPGLPLPVLFCCVFSHCVLLCFAVFVCVVSCSVVFC